VTEKPVRFLRVQGLARDWSKHTFQEHFQRSRFSSFECKGFHLFSVLDFDVVLKDDLSVLGMNHNKVLLKHSFQTFNGGVDMTKGGSQIHKLMLNGLSTLFSEKAQWKMPLLNEVYDMVFQHV